MKTRIKCSMGKLQLKMVNSIKAENYWYIIAR